MEPAAAVEGSPRGTLLSISGIEDPVRLTHIHRTALQVGSLDEFRALLRADASAPHP